MKKKTPRVLVLFSGGLDSRIVIKILKEQIDSKNIYAMYFLLPFGGRYPDSKKAEEFCKEEGINFILMDATKNSLFKDYMDIIKNPKHGRGNALNPCIDCKIFMLKKAKAYSKKNKIDIIATGEVLHQRPMSQNKRALLLIEKESGLIGEILRPLSARKMDLTISERDGLVKRDLLLDVEGRQRGIQIELSKKYNIDYPNPSGGCILCEKLYTNKIKELLKKKDLSFLDIQLSKIGRHFFNSKIVLGRNNLENEKLIEFHKRFKKGIIIIPQDNPGPSALVLNKNMIEDAQELIRKYSRHDIKKFKVE